MKEKLIIVGVILLFIVLAYGGFTFNRWWNRDYYGIVAVEKRLERIEKKIDMLGVKK